MTRYAVTINGFERAETADSLVHRLSTDKALHLGLTFTVSESHNDEPPFDYSDGGAWEECAECDGSGYQTNPLDGQPYECESCNGDGTVAL